MRFAQTYSNCKLVNPWNNPLGNSVILFPYNTLQAEDKILFVKKKKKKIFLTSVQIIFNSIRTVIPTISTRETHRPPPF